MNLIKILTILSFAVFGGPLAAFAAGPSAVNLSSAGNFVIISETGITNTGSHTTAITGNIGSSPITAAAMDNVFCSEMTGTIYGVDTAYIGSGDQTCFLGDAGAKILIDSAILDMGSAYTDAAGRTTPDATELYAGNIGGHVFTAGLYKWGTDVTISNDVTLSGGANDVWIFQIAGDLNVASGGSIPTGVKIQLLGGAQAKNVFWQVGGVTGATLGTFSTFNGNILTAKQVIIQTGAVLNGRALAQTQVTLDANLIGVPSTVVAATLHVIKSVSNVHGYGTAVPSDFTLYVKLAGSDVSGSPAFGTTTPGTLYTLAADTYVVSEDSNPSYTQAFSGDCDVNGAVTLVDGLDKTCTITNTDIAAPVPPPVASSGGSSGRTHFGCTDPAALNYSQFVASDPTLCLYGPAVVPLFALINPIPVSDPILNPVFVPGFPHAGFSPQQKSVQDTPIVYSCRK